MTGPAVPTRRLRLVLVPRLALARQLPRPREAACCPPANTDYRPKLSGKLKIGVINSIGVRKDAKALDMLTKLIDDSDPAIAGAAAASVGMIGGMQASRALQAALGRTKLPVFAVVARACLMCAESVPKARGLELYGVLQAENMPKPVRLAALRNLNAAGPAPEYTKKWLGPHGRGRQGGQERLPRPVVTASSRAGPAAGTGRDASLRSRRDSPRRCGGSRHSRWATSRGPCRSGCPSSRSWRSTPA